ncbi:MAG TPA: NUDIX hydrolase [Lachnospiraceae bacterium]|nr:NUDIX hydrolase [Lachnospiraceae bacterium]
MGIIRTKTPDIGDLRSSLAAYRPCCLQEAKDKDRMLYCIDRYPDILSRQNELAHFTASSWIVNHQKTKILMVFHNIYHAWAWTGGHADGDADLCTVALREAYEETGIFIPMYANDIFSLEAVSVPGHMKNSGWVSAHIHLNVTYVFFADEALPLKIKPDENSGVQWFPVDQAVAASTEPEMQVIYQKLNNKLFGYSMF